MLQRGRAPESAEIRHSCAIVCVLHLLQRGRAPESAEMYAQPARIVSDHTASTGPRSGERGDA